MFVNKLRLIATTLLFLAAVATGAGYLTHSLASQDEPKRQPDAPRPQVAARPDDTTQRPAPGRMFVVGPCARPPGQAGAQCHDDGLRGDQAAGERPAVEGDVDPTAIGQASSDSSGRFQARRPAHLVSPASSVGAVALAPGYGAGWAESTPTPTSPPPTSHSGPSR